MFLEMSGVKEDLVDKLLCLLTVPSLLSYHMCMEKYLRTADI